MCVRVFVRERFCGEPPEDNPPPGKKKVIKRRRSNRGQWPDEGQLWPEIDVGRISLDRFFAGVVPKSVFVCACEKEENRPKSRNLLRNPD